MDNAELVSAKTGLQLLLVSQPLSVLEVAMLTKAEKKNTLRQDIVDFAKVYSGKKIRKLLN